MLHKYNYSYISFIGQKQIGTTLPTLTLRL